MFEDTFPLSKAAPEPRSAIEALGLPHARPRKAGVYSRGLVVLISAGFDMRCFASWRATNAKRFAAIGYTALGDFLLWDHEKNVVQYLDVKKGMLTETGDTIDAVLDEVLTQPETIEGLLLRKHVENIILRKGPLRYGKCFICAPFRLAGGTPEPRNYSAGDVRVYVNLAGQMLFAPDDA